MTVRFAGYAAIFNQPDRGGDVIRKGAFARSLANRAPVPLLHQHRPGSVVGRIESVAEDSRGLRVIGEVSDAATADALAKGALTGLSFGYRARQARQGTNRELIDVDLIEVSLVAHPMQPLARVHAVTEFQQGDDHVRSEG
jgi:HK97 family phage prohead protease